MRGRRRRRRQRASRSCSRGGASEEAPPERIPIPQSLIIRSSPGRRLTLASVAELAAVIKTQGFQGTLVARPHPKQPGMYELAFGHRRREAARAAGAARPFR